MALTESQIAAHQKADQLLQELLADPKLGAEVRQRAKQKFPDTVFVEDKFEPMLAPLREIATAADTRAKAAEDALAALRSERDQEQASAKFDRDVAAVKAKLSLTDEGVAKTIERMKALKNYTDIEGAARAVIADTPIPPSSQPTPSWLPQRLNFAGTAEYDEQLVKLHRDPQGYMDQQLREFVANPDRYVEDTFGRAA